MYSSLYHVLSSTTKELPFKFQQRHEIFLFSKTSRLPLMPTQVYMQCIPDDPALGGTQREHKAGYTPPSSIEIWNALSYTSTPPPFVFKMLNYA